MNLRSLYLGILMANLVDSNMPQHLQDARFTNMLLLITECKVKAVKKYDLYMTDMSHFN
jgi:hypothetical protein